MEQPSDLSVSVTVGEGVSRDKTITELLAEEERALHEILVEGEDDDLLEFLGEKENTTSTTTSHNNNNHTHNGVATTKEKGKQKVKFEEEDKEATQRSFLRPQKKRKKNALALPPRSVETVVLEFNEVRPLRRKILDLTFPFRRRRNSMRLSKRKAWRRQVNSLPIVFLELIKIYFFMKMRGFIRAGTVLKNYATV